MDARGADLAERSSLPLWVDPPGYFCREPLAREVKFAFTNYGVAVGLEAAGAWQERVTKLIGFFETYRSHDEYDHNAITHVMACSARLPGDLLRRDASRPRRV